MKGLIAILVFLSVCQITAAQERQNRPRLLFTSKEKSRVCLDSPYSYSFIAIDSDQNLLAYSVKNLPDWLHFDSGRHLISGEPSKAGQFPVQLQVDNGTSQARQNFMLTVYDRQTVNILALGNSITNGVDTFNSYRRDLWQLLHNGHYNFDFIGSWSRHHLGGEVPDPDFDLDHEGHSGWTFDNFLNPPDWDSSRGNLNLWLQNYQPDLVLVELGTNDVFQCVITETMIQGLSRLTEALRNNNKRVKIFLAQILPMGPHWAGQKLCGKDITYGESIVRLNKAIADFAVKNTKLGSPIIIVDQYTGIDPGTNLFDDIHPNSSGEKVMAARWFTAIKPYLVKLR